MKFKRVFTFLVPFFYMIPEATVASVSGNLVVDAEELEFKFNQAVTGSSAVYMSSDGKTVSGASWTESWWSTNNGLNAVIWGDDIGRIKIGTFKYDGSGISYSTGISSNGDALIGIAETDDGYTQAFYWNKNDRKISPIGTLAKDSKGFSIANGISSDGLVVYGTANIDSQYTQAFYWNVNERVIKGLGTIADENTGYSSVYGASSDGSVLVGSADNNNGDEEAFIWHRGDQKIKGLGTLKKDNSGISQAVTVSSDGKVVAGSASTDNDDIQAFIWNAGDERLTGIGTLRSDNKGSSQVRKLADNGNILIGVADTDAGSMQAYIWHKGDKSATSLGSLRVDNSGSSFANNINPQGTVVVGQAETDAGFMQAFIWQKGDMHISNLGTLKADGTGTSTANAVSDDGKVVAGTSSADSGNTHAAIWKISYANPEPEEKPGINPEPEEKPDTSAEKTPGTTPEYKPGTTPEPVVKIVDVENSHLAMLDTASRAQRVLALYQAALTGLTGTRCELGADNYCLGAFTQYDRSPGNSMNTTGLFGAIKLLPSDKLTAGASVNFAGPVNLMSGYDSDGSRKPGLGVFTRWQDNVDGTGLSVDVAGAFIQQDVTIRRERLSNTEAGKGDASVKGWHAKGAVSWGFMGGENTLVAPVAGLTWQDVSRSAYTETRDAEFAARYGKMGNKSVSLNTGVELTHQTGSSVTMHAGAGADITLSRQRAGFTGNIDYIGAFAYDHGQTRDVKPYVRAAVSVGLTPNSAVQASTGWQETDYRTDSIQASLSYSYHW